MKHLLLLAGKLSGFAGVMLCLAGGGFCQSAQAQSEAPKVVKDVSYVSKADASDYEISRCMLDLYLPAEKGFPTLVWFHGGGLQNGNKSADNFPKLGARLSAAGIGFVSVNYRLSPKAQYPAYIEDGASAVAWVVRNIESYGGAAKDVFVGGHSAGGYLALMVGMDAHYLKANGLNLSALAGVIPVSGQVMTHYTVREERGIDKHTITADDAAPVFHIRKGLPPMLVLYADDDMPARAEENMYFVAMAQDVGNKDIRGYQAKSRTHGGIGRRLWEEGDPACGVMVEWMKNHARSQ